MIRLIILGVCIGMAVSRPQDPPPAAPAAAAGPPASGGNVTIVKSESDNPGDGTFKFSYELSDGTKARQSGRQINPGTDHEGTVIEGEYSYKGPDGKVYTVSYVSDANGFQPKGEHIKVPPVSNATETTLAPGVEKADPNKP